MRLSHNDKNELLKRLPILKLSYENIHKKVSSELYYLIPKGVKHLVWFTYFQDKKVCILIEMNTGVQNSIKNMFIVPQMFEKKMVLGTIMYGTLFNVNGNQFFSVENIHFYKGKNIEDSSELSKMTLLKHIFDNELKQTVMTKNGICLGMPIIETTFETAIDVAKQLPYEIYSIQQRNFNDKKQTYCSTIYKASSIEEQDNKVFLIKPDIQNDIYHLYVKNNYGDLEKYDIAAVPDYKTSVMMNKIFRNIKENRNLDALEESDDDEEFEDIREDKFVKLDKSVTMECAFHKKHNVYVPLKIIERGIIATRSSMDVAKQRLEQNNTYRNNNNNNNNSSGQRNHSNQPNHNNQRYNNHNQRYNNHNQQYNNQSNQSNGQPGHRKYNPHSQINHYRQSFNQ
jgi:hypothetical protein